MKYFRDLKDAIWNISVVGAVLGVMGVSIVSGEYADISGIGFKGMEGARGKNSISAVVGGIIGQKLYGNSEIDLTLKKVFWPNSKLRGITTSNSINTDADLTFGRANFRAKKTNGKLEGEVDKSEFDWKVEQSGEDRYKIGRFGPKFDGELYLVVKDGRVRGEFHRYGFNISWGIDGKYDKEGNVDVEIDGPLTLGVDLVGKIEKR